MKNLPQRERLIQYLQDVYGAEPEHLWAKYPNYAVFRHSSSKKWFAAVMDVPKDRLGLTGDATADLMNLKCSPLMLGSLLAEKGFLPAYHMNKNTWISILLDGSVPDETIISLLEFSYGSVSPKRSRKTSDRQEDICYGPCEPPPPPAAD